MNKIGDDELRQILSRVTDPDDRKSASQVCKGWWVMEAQSRSSLGVFNLHHLPRLLAKYPNLTTFGTREGMSNADLALVARSCPKLEAIKLDAITSFRGLPPAEVMKILRLVHQVDDEGLCALANGCPRLSKIVLQRKGVGMVGVMAMIRSAARNLTHLVLDRCSSVSDQAFEAIESSSCPIRVLSLEGCSITDAGLRILANGHCSKTIKHLNLTSCFGITNDGVSFFCKMRVLEELDLAGCNKVTDVGGLTVSAFQTLKKLNLSCLLSLTEQTFVAVAENCINLERLILHAGIGITRVGIVPFLGHKSLQSLVLIGVLSDDLGSAFESLALQCPSLESIVVPGCRRERLLQEMQESTVSMQIPAVHSLLKISFDKSQFILTLVRCLKFCRRAYSVLDSSMCLSLKSMTWQ